MTSPDGIVWTSHTTPNDKDWYSVCWSPELKLFCAVGYYPVGLDTYMAMTSSSGG
jgi:hypothetical protein